MTKHIDAEWLPDALRYVSHIGDGPGDTVSLFSEKGEGKPRLRAELIEGALRVLDRDHRVVGGIESKGFIPTSRYRSLPDSAEVWRLVTRSIVRKQHALTLAGGEEWTFDTPFYWWQRLAGSESGVTRLLGSVGRTKRDWVILIEPGRDTDALLSAVAFMHRQWWRS